MNSNSFFRSSSFCSLLVALLLVGCTSGPELQKYPRRQMERPYTLPDGVATWETISLSSYTKDDSGSSFLWPIPIPLVWRSSLSDTWTLNWSPLPLSVSHQLSYSKDQVWGTTFGMTGGWTSWSGVIINPSISLYHRLALGESWALQTTPIINATYRTKEGTGKYYGGISSGPMFQLTDTFALTPSVGLYIDTGYKALSFETESVDPEPTTRLTVPLRLAAAWSFDRQWDLNTTYSFNRIGHTRGYTEHLAYIHLVHYW